MSKSRLIILGVAVVAAVAAGYMAKNMAATGQEGVIEAAAPGPQIDLTEVLVMSRDVPMGETLGDALGWQPWPSDAVNKAFIRRDRDPEAAENLQHSIARIALYAGEPLKRTELIGEGQSFMSAILPPGKRAVATQIAVDTSAGGFILPNDRVDVIMTRSSQAMGAADGYVTETILRNVRVLAIDQMIQEDEEGRRVKVGETATLELTPEQAEVITVAQEMADRLTLSLRSLSDTNEPAETSGAYLVTGAGSGDTVRMIKSGEMSVVGTRQ